VKRVFCATGELSRDVTLIRGVLLTCAVAVGMGLPTFAQSPSPAPEPVQNSVNAASARTEFGFGIFQQKCLSCHGKAQYERAPSPAALREMSPEHLYDVLSQGTMFPVIGNQLSEHERRLVAESISGRLMGAAASGDAAAPRTPL